MIVVYLYACSWILKVKFEFLGPGLSVGTFGIGWIDQAMKKHFTSTMQITVSNLHPAHCAIIAVSSRRSSRG